MKILIVDPDPNRQRQLRTILTSLGYKSGEIESMNDSKAAVTGLRKKKFDLVFIGMLDGDETLPFLKEVRSGSISKAPCVVFSTEVTKESVVSAAEAGANSFLAYPFSVSDVESSIKQASKAGSSK